MLNSLPKLTDEQQLIKEKVLLGLKLNRVGKATAITNKEMIEGLSRIGFEKVSDTVIRKIINQLRHEGHAVCSSGNGYYLAATEDELKECINDLQARVDAQLATLEALKKCKPVLKKHNV